MINTCVSYSSEVIDWLTDGLNHRLRDENRWSVFYLWIDPPEAPEDCVLTNGLLTVVLQHTPMFGLVSFFTEEFVMDSFVLGTNATDWDACLGIAPAEAEDLRMPKAAYE